VRATLTDAVDRAAASASDLQSSALVAIRDLTVNGAAGARSAAAELRTANSELTKALREIRLTLQRDQTRQLAAEEDDITSMQRIEYVIGGLFLLMVLGATVYGSRLRREFERRTGESESYLRELETTHGALSRARDELEARVEQRTNELARANAALSAEVEDRRRVEADLRLSEERYALAAHSANDGLWDWDLRRGQFYSSPRWRALLGATDDDVSGNVNEWMDRVHPDDRVALQVKIGAHLQDPSHPLELEHRMRHNDGDYRWMLVRATAVTDPGGQAARMVGSHADVTARKNAELQLIHVALHDTLTSLANRAYFMDHLDTVLKRSRTPMGTRFAVLFIDLDRFKVVNDSLGHAIGDQLLVEVSRRLTAVVRPGDMVARLGGDEFTILLENLASEDSATNVADRLLHSLAEPLHLGGYEVRVGASIGIAFGALAYTSPGEILRDADTAMYQAKSDGRGLYRVFESSMYDEALDSLVLESELSIAVEREQFRLQYQPIIDTGSGRISGLEALVRWMHPARGLISPNDFVSIAEATGDIVSIGRWVLQQVARQLSLWQQTLVNSSHLTVSVNVSPRELGQVDFVPYVAGLLREYRITPSSLRFEIPERAIAKNPGETAIVLRNLAALGVGITIDDFGSGRIPAETITDLPADAVKIDRGSVAGLVPGSETLDEVTATIGLARSLGLRLIAEGIETSAQQRLLASLGCTFGQGFLYFAPLEPDEVAGVLATAPHRTNTTG
ncbi:MAG: putative bifunctional diguanylate cyclase/phosphodiesterase, partial [Ilumatobacteraceae bacterium]